MPDIILSIPLWAASLIVPNNISYFLFLFRRSPARGHGARRVMKVLPVRGRYLLRGIWGQVFLVHS